MIGIYYRNDSNIKPESSANQPPYKQAKILPEK
jgi:hypothetical protein